jgi:hypothetical protein
MNEPQFDVFFNHVFNSTTRSRHRRCSAPLSGCSCDRCGSLRVAVTELRAAGLLSGLPAAIAVRAVPMVSPWAGTGPATAMAPAGHAMPDSQPRLPAADAAVDPGRPASPSPSRGPRDHRCREALGPRKGPPWAARWLNLAAEAFTRIRATWLRLAISALAPGEALLRHAAKQSVRTAQLAMCLGVLPRWPRAAPSPWVRHQVWLRVAPPWLRLHGAAQGSAPPPPPRVAQLCL